MNLSIYLRSPILDSWVDRRRNRKKGEMGRSSGARAYAKIDRYRRASRVARDSERSIYLSILCQKQARIWPGQADWPRLAGAPRCRPGHPLALWQSLLGAFLVETKPRRALLSDKGTHGAPPRPDGEMDAVDGYREHERHREADCAEAELEGNACKRFTGWMLKGMRLATKKRSGTGDNLAMLADQTPRHTPSPPSPCT